MFYHQAKKSKFNFNIIEDYQSIDSKENLNAPFFAKSDFLKHSADVNPQVRHIMIEASSDNKTLANFYFQIMPFKGSELKSYIPQGEDCIINKTMEAMVDMALERVNWNLAVMGNVFVTGDNGQYWKTDNLADEIKWEIVEEASSFLFKNLKVDAYLISDLREEDLKGHDKLLQNGYRFFEVEPDLIFDIDSSWSSFDDYMASVVSKYRVRTKKVLEKSTLLDIRDLDLDSLITQEKEIYQLYKNVIDSAAFKLVEITADYFHKFKKVHPNLFFVKGFYLENKLVGVISYFEDTEVLYMNFVGLDYTFNKDHCIYQRVLYDAIEQGILKGKKHIHFGRTASEIKTAVGAKPVKAYSLLKHNSKIPNMAIKPLTSYLKPEPFQVRHPFKSKAKVSS